MYNLVNNQCGCEIGPPSGGADGLDTICANLHSGVGFTALRGLPGRHGHRRRRRRRVARGRVRGRLRQPPDQDLRQRALHGHADLHVHGIHGHQRHRELRAELDVGLDQIIVEFGGHLAITGLAANPLAYRRAPARSAATRTTSRSGTSTRRASATRTTRSGATEPSRLQPHGHAEVTCGSNHTYTASRAAFAFDATWTILNNTAGASLRRVSELHERDELRGAGRGRALRLVHAAA